MDNGIRFVETIESEAWKPLELSKVFILYTYRTGCSWILTGTELRGLVYRQCGIFDSKEHAEEALFKFPDVPLEVYRGCALVHSGMYQGSRPWEARG